jgi:hypothetical protein
VAEGEGGFRNAEHIRCPSLTHFGRVGNFVFSPNLTGAVTTKLTNMSLILAIFHTIRRARRKLDSHL